jgi:hypothetical protein
VTTTADEMARRRNSAAGRVSRIRQKRPADDPERLAMELELAEAVLAEYVSKTISKFPPLREDQVARLIAIMRTAGGDR